jgi:hypothetical protein
MVSSRSFGPEPCTSTIAGTRCPCFGNVSVPGSAGDPPTITLSSSKVSGAA